MSVLIEDGIQKSLLVHLETTMTLVVETPSAAETASWSRKGLLLVALVCSLSTASYALEKRHTPTMSEFIYKELAAAQSLIDVEKFDDAIGRLDALLQSKRRYNKTELAQIHNLVGFCYFSQAKYTEAIVHYESVIKYRSHISIGLERSTLYTLAQLRFVTLDYDQSLRHFTQWKSITDSLQPEEYAFHAQILYSLKLYPDAEITMEKGIALAKKNSRPIKQQWETLLEYLRKLEIQPATLSGTTVEEAMGIGNYQEALRIAKRELATLRSMPNQDIRQIALRNNDIGQALLSLGRPTEAKDNFLIAYNRMSSHPPDNHADLGAYTNNLGLAYAREGNLLEAEKYYLIGLKHRQKAFGEAHSIVAESLSNLAVTMENKDDFQSALRYHESAIAIYKKSADGIPERLAILTSNFALFHKQRGNLEQAELLAREALKILKAELDPDHPMIGQALGNQASILQDAGKYAESRTLYEEALAHVIANHGEDHPLSAVTASNYGTMLSSMGDPAKAIVHQKRALAIYRGALIPNYGRISSVLSNLGANHLNLGKRNKAKEYFEEALDLISKRSGLEHTDTATVFSGLAELASLEGKQARARTLLRRSLAINTEVHTENHPTTATIVFNLASHSYRNGDLKVALVETLRTLKIQREVYSEHHPHLAATLILLAKIQMKLGNKEESIANMKQALAIEEQALSAILLIGTDRDKKAYLKKISNSISVIISLLVRYGEDNHLAGEISLETILRRKGRALDVSMQNVKNLRLNLPNKALRDEIIELQGLRSQIILNPLTNKQSDSLSRIRSLEHEIQGLEDRLAKASEKFRTLSKVPSAKEVQTTLASTEALIEFAAFAPMDTSLPPQYLAFVLHNTGKHRWVVLGDMNQIDKEIQVFRNSISRRKADVRETGLKLYHSTFGKIAGLLGENVTKLVLSPDSELNLVSFAALTDDTGQYLIEKYGLSYVSSGRDLLRRNEQSEPSNQPIVIGDVAFDGEIGPTTTLSSMSRAFDMTDIELAPLPGTRIEAEKIAAIYGLAKTQLLLGNRANEKAVKAVSKPFFLHIATHGFFLPELTLPASKQSEQTRPPATFYDPAVRSGLALSGFNKRGGANGANDGVLTAYEVAGLDLFGTELVTLSACETGVGQTRIGQSVDGLRRALVLTGARSQLLSLWNLPDFATQSFMVSWYAQLKAGISRRAALRNTQISAVKGRTLPLATDDAIIGQHPFYWAGLVLLGETSALRAQD